MWKTDFTIVLLLGLSAVIGQNPGDIAAASFGVSESNNLNNPLSSQTTFDIKPGKTSADPNIKGRGRKRGRKPKDDDKVTMDAAANNPAETGMSTNQQNQDTNFDSNFGLAGADTNNPSFEIQSTSTVSQSSTPSDTTSVETSAPSITTTTAASQSTSSTENDITRSPTTSDVTEEISSTIASSSSDNAPTTSSTVTRASTESSSSDLTAAPTSSVSSTTTEMTELSSIASSTSGTTSTSSPSVSETRTSATTSSPEFPTSSTVSSIQSTAESTSFSVTTTTSTDETSSASTESPKSAVTEHRCRSGTMVTEETAIRCSLPNGLCLTGQICEPVASGPSGVCCPATIPAGCPPPRPGSRILCLVQQRYQCESDTDCGLGRRCCPSTCGNTCKRLSRGRSRLLNIIPGLNNL